MLDLTEDDAFRCVDYLTRSAKLYGAARGRMVYYAANLRRVKALEMMGTLGSVAEREVRAYASDAYLQAMRDEQNATAEYEELRALREAASSKFECWRSLNSSRRQGIVT